MAAQTAFESSAAAHGAHAGNASGLLRFRDLPRSSATTQPDSVASPLLANAWAEAILRFWEAGIAAGSVDPAKPLYLFDPAPGEGQLAWLLLRALQQALGGSTLQPCYVACGTDAAQLDHLTSHPYLAEYVESGWFDTALWDACGSDAPTLRAQNIALLRTDNPVAILSLQWFGTLAADLYAVHEGEIMEGWVVPATRPETPETPQAFFLDYDWRPADEAALVHAPQSRLLAHCNTRFTSAALLLPTAACEATDAFARLSGGRYLLLSADFGCHTEQQLRLGACLPPAAWPREGAALPVNHHALSHHQQQQGARTWNRQLQDDGMVVHAAWRDDSLAAASTADDMFDTLVAPLLRTHPDDLAALSACINGAPATLALLRLSGHDPRILKTGMQAMLEHACMLDATARREWQSDLWHTWNNYLPTADGDSFFFHTGMLAVETGDWELAKTCFRTGLALYGNDATVLHHLAYCEAATGGSAEAMPMLAHALAIDPGHVQCLPLHTQLVERLQRWENTDWYHADIASSDELCIEPLGPEHAASLFYQYRDEQIGIMTRLPELTTLEATTDWIEKQRRKPARAAYAVMHRRWGFVGVVSVCCAADAGYFYFWSGADFQDQGFGKKAARLLFAQMARKGMVHVFTSAYLHNTRSRNALASLDFNQMQLRAQAPDDDLLFFHLPLQATDQVPPTVLAKKIVELCSAIQSPITFSTAVAELTFSRRAS